MNGKLIKCERCNGSGIGQKASAYQPWDEECGDCGGSGKNWQYSGGAVAKYYSGPLIGRYDPECTDCDGTGVTFQTERHCSCDAGIALSKAQVQS